MICLKECLIKISTRHLKISYMILQNKAGDNDLFWVGRSRFPENESCSEVAREIDFIKDIFKDVERHVVFLITKFLRSVAGRRPIHTGFKIRFIQNKSITTISAVHGRRPLYHKGGQLFHTGSQKFRSTAEGRSTKQVEGCFVAPSSQRGSARRFA